MAMIDPNIALQVNTQGPDIAGAIARGMQYQHLGLQNQLAQQQLAGATRQQAEEQTFSDAAKAALGPDGSFDRNAYTQYLTKNGLGHRLPAVMEQFQKMDAQKAEVTAKTFQTAKDMNDAVVSGLSPLASDPQASSDKALSLAANLAARFPMARDHILSAVQSIPTTGNPADIQAWARQLVQGAASQSQRYAAIMPKPTEVDTGGTKTFVDTNPLTNPGIVGSSVAKTQTPGEVASNRIRAAEVDPYGLLGINKGGMAAQPAGAPAIPDVFKGAKVTLANGQTVPGEVAYAHATGQPFEATQAPGQPVSFQSTPGGTPAGTSPITAATGAAPNLAGLRGEDLLKALPAPLAAQVKQLAEGRQAFPGGFAMKSPQIMSLLSLVSQYDPSFDAVNYNGRNATYKDFTSGKAAQNITALNTAIYHLGNLNDNLDKLNNTRSPTLNNAENWLANAGIGTNSWVDRNQANIKAVQADANAVAGEMAKVFRSTGMSEQDINSWKQGISAATTPAQKQGIISEALNLMHGRLQALQDQYTQGMGTVGGGFQFVKPGAQAVLDRLHQITGGQPAAAAPASGAPGVKFLGFEGQ